LEGEIIPSFTQADCFHNAGAWGQACLWSDGHYTWGAC
jgi:hypothetical protein